MEPEGKITVNYTNVSWNSEANWAMAAGSLENCVTFESSLYSTDDGDVEVEAITVDSTPKCPLIMYPPLADSGPCEIKIIFAQKYEVRQVYVRSTARVYEMYSASNEHSSHEYLCTVRCGIATRDGEVLHAPDVEEIVSSHIKGSNKEMVEENIKSEDDWVEVKVSDASLLDRRNISFQTKPCMTSAKSIQDLFEATAEITDANPCISITLRLLSLQSKGCIFVDEIYVFADPVASSNLESQESHKENSSASSLMAMFFPTLMQLSKTTGLSRPNEKYSSVRKEKQDFPEAYLEETHRSDSVVKTQLEGKASITDPQEVKLQEGNGGSVDPSDKDIPSQASTTESNNSEVPLQVAPMERNHGNSLGGNVEGVLEQLVSRMGRIEELCLGFQEKMVKPMSSIEARLQRVEQQLETLTKNLQNSGVSSCSRISAPDGSCAELDANSCDNCCGCTVTEGNKSDEKNFHMEVLSVSSDELADSANTVQLLPGLVVTAPEFPDGEDEEENNAWGPEIKFSNENQRRDCSIDDALASALTGLLSSLSLQTPKYTRSLTVTAPEFSNEDDENNDASPRALHEIDKNDSVHIEDCERIEIMQESASSNISLEGGEKLNTYPTDINAEDTAKEADKDGQNCRGQGDLDVVGVKASIVAEDNSRTGFNCLKEELKNRKISSHISDGLFSNVSDANDILQNLIATVVNSGCSIPQGGVFASTDHIVATEVPNKASHEDIIENVLGFSRASPVVDFEIPLLDVKFVSQKNPVTESFLESLMAERPETDFQGLSVKESSDDLPVKEQVKSNDDFSVEEQDNLITVDDKELVNPVANSQLLVDRDCCTMMNLPVNVEGDNLPEDHKSNNDETLASSLI